MIQTSIDKRRKIILDNQKFNVRKLDEQESNERKIIRTKADDMKSKSQNRKKEEAKKSKKSMISPQSDNGHEIKDFQVITDEDKSSGVL